MKLKVIHLIRRLERIERDLEELGNLQNTIHEDREYAGRLRDSLVEETLRLKKLRNRLYSQIIKNPPVEALQERPFTEAAAVADGDRASSPEIVLPKHPSPSAKGTQEERGMGEKRSGAGEAGGASNPALKAPEKKGRAEQSPKNETSPPPAAAKDQSGDSPFRFVFDTGAKGPNP